MRIEYIFVIFFTILTVVFWSGKGGWLMACYNIMSDEEKQKYNYKRPRRVMGEARELSIWFSSSSV